ncbi:MAG: AAA family ATPase [Candidatus Thorarchaeota archaeon]
MQIISREFEQILLQSGKISHIYGPPKVGKSTLSAVIAMELALLDKDTMIISTERPIEIRLDSMIESYERYDKKLLERILTANIFTMDELLQTINNNLIEYVEQVDLIILDSLTSAYRGNSSPVSLTLLRKALSKLQNIAYNNRMPILFTNQVASKMDESSDFRPVASATTRNYSDFTIRLSRKIDSKTEISFENMLGEEEAVLESFQITAQGIEDFNYLFEIQF